jgi:hypothetical protein
LSFRYRRNLRLVTGLRAEATTRQASSPTKKKIFNGLLVTSVASGLLAAPKHGVGWWPDRLAHGVNATVSLPFKSSHPPVVAAGRLLISGLGRAVLTLPPTGQTHRFVAQVSKPAVSPTFRLRGAPKRRSGATAAKSARRWESHRLRVWKPATQQTWKLLC